MKNYYNKSTIVLISYKSEQKIYDFIKRIPKKIKIIIIENSNNIELKKRIEKKNKNIRVFIKKNEGVSSSINFAVKKIKTKYFLQISPDILFNYNDINEFIKVAIKIKDKFSALGPRFVNVKKNHKQISKNLKIGSISSVHGSCMFINKKRFQEIGGFDENFFLYFEETDYCWRSTINGFGIYQINDSKVEHDIGSSVEIYNDEEKIKLKELCLWHFIWSKYYLSTKKNGHLKSKIFFFPIIVKILLRILIYNLINQKDKKKKIYN